MAGSPRERDVDTIATGVGTPNGLQPIGDPTRSAGEPVPPPVKVAWREGTLTRVKELESLAAWCTCPGEEPVGTAALRTALGQHLDAARGAAADGGSRVHDGALLERAMSNLDAAEADMLQLADEDYLLGLMPSILNHVQRHLQAGDPRRTEVEWLAERLRPNRARSKPAESPEEQHETRKQAVKAHRYSIVSAYRGASSAALREQTRVRSFRNVVVLTAAGMTLVAVALIVIGAIRPTFMPLCFAPEDGGNFMVVCPTRQSEEMPVDRSAAATENDIDAAVQTTVTSSTSRSWRSSASPRRRSPRQRRSGASAGRPSLTVCPSRLPCSSCRRARSPRCSGCC